MRLAVVLLLLLVAGCSTSSPSPSPATDPAQRADSWIAMVPGDAFPFDGPAGEALLIYVDETYAVDDTNASALTWKMGEEYTTDFFVQDDDGTLWWYGRRGEWRAGKRGEERREVAIVDHRATFGDRSITLSEDGDPTRLETPEGVFTR